MIVGAGASGLSLACHLAASGWRDREILLVDDGSRPLAERAWAYWSHTDGLLDEAVSASFDRFAVRTQERSRVVELDDYAYHVVRGVDLARTSETVLSRAPRLRRMRGRVTAIDDGLRDAVVVVDGQEMRATWVFDSVGLDLGPPPAPAPAPAPMTLTFTGRRIETTVDAFDPAVPTLMDFRTRQAGDLAFVYVLPTSPRTALVELTRFTSDPGRACGPDEASLDAYVRDILAIGPHSVLGTEHGVIALRTARPPRPGRHVVPIGAPAGMVKPSTGYGYGRIQRHSAALTRSLVARGHPFDVPASSLRHRALDAVLLEAIRREPARVVDVFERMFAANDGDRVMAFLDEATSVGQELALIRTLPPRPFLRALGRVLTHAGPAVRRPSPDR